MTTSQHLRLATPEDADAIADVFTASRRLLTFLPRLHTPEEDRGFIRGHILSHYRVTVAVKEDRIVGFMSDEPGWIENLYLSPEVIGRGIGSTLLADAKARNDRLELWCFLENHTARAFYGKHGFIEVERTDGSNNEERCADVRLRWERKAAAGGPR